MSMRKWLLLMMMIELVLLEVLANLLELDVTLTWLLLFVSLFLDILLWVCVLGHGYKSKNIAHPPGTRFSKIIEFLYSKKEKERVFDAILADMHEEYFDALDQGRKWKMRWIHARGIINILTAVAVDLPFSFAKKVYEIFKVG